MAIEVHGGAPLVQVFDLPKSIQFCRDLLGFTVTGKPEPMSADPDDVNCVMLELGTATIMLNTAYDPDDVPATPDRRGGQDTRTPACISAARMWTARISI